MNHSHSCSTPIRHKEGLGQYPYGTDLPATKKEAAWLRKAIEVELEGVVAIVEEFHGL